MRTPWYSRDPENQWSYRQISWDGFWQLSPTVYNGIHQGSVIHSGLSTDQRNWDLKNMVERMVECCSTIEQVVLTFTHNKLFSHKEGCWVCPAEAANIYFGGTRCRTTSITSTRTGKDTSDISSDLLLSHHIPMIPSTTTGIQFQD